MPIRPTVMIKFWLECWRYVTLLLWNRLQSFLTVILIKVCFLISGKNQIYILFKKKVTNKLTRAIISSLWKDIWKIIFNYLYKNLQDNKLVHQSGFQSNESCVNQLLSTVNDLYKASDPYPTLETCGVFLDMSKAFDKVWHKGLIFKPKSLGVSDALLCLIESFLMEQWPSG